MIMNYEIEFCNWCNTMENSMDLSKTLDIQLHYITQQFYSWEFIWKNEIKNWKIHACQLFIAALFITVKIWKQPVSLNRLIVDKQDMVYTEKSPHTCQNG